ncbi:MAG: Fur family transcriptional regulator [Verrucomicrobiota bacterium]
MEKELSEPAIEMPDGMRMTRQRRVVYDVVRDMDPEHPTASAVYERCKKEMPSISLATVYNCLEALTDAGAITQVNIDREASRFCPNLQPHAHFFCAHCDSVFDINLRDQADASEPWNLPSGSEIEQINVAMRGVCPECLDKKAPITLSNT